MGVMVEIAAYEDTAGAEPPRSGIVWLASYPKSGNTWTRAFLHNLLMVMSDEAGAQDINGMSRFSTSAGGFALYAETLGYEPTNRHRKEIAAVRPQVQQKLADDFDGLIFIKTHHALVHDRGTMTINTDVTAGAVYILRNPLDVAISFSHHLGISIDDTIALMGNVNAETPVSDKLVYEVYTSWSKHVMSWTRTPHPALLVMRYEDMLDDPVACFGALARHLLLHPSPDELARAIRQSSFDELRRQEDADGFRERSQKAERFFREGRAGQWREVLSPAQVDRIVAAHGEQMARFGYLPL